MVAMPETRQSRPDFLRRPRLTDEVHEISELAMQFPAKSGNLRLRDTFSCAARCRIGFSRSVPATGAELLP